MNPEPDGEEHISRKLDCAARQILRNMSAFAPDDLEEMVRHRPIDAKAVPAELLTDLARHKLRLTR